MNPQLISFSLQKESVIITYLQDGNEINAFIEPYQFCTYLVDLEVINDRGRFRGETIFNYSNSGNWYSWETLISTPNMIAKFTNELMTKVLIRHIETENIKTLFLTLNN